MENEKNSTPVGADLLSPPKGPPPPGTAFTWLTGSFKGDDRMQIAQINLVPGGSTLDVKVGLFEWKAEESKMHYFWNGIVNLTAGLAYASFLAGDMSGDGHTDF